MEAYCEDRGNCQLPVRSEFGIPLVPKPPCEAVMIFRLYASSYRIIRRKPTIGQYFMPRYLFSEPAWDPISLPP